jgi:hypothetical protein
VSSFFASHKELFIPQLVASRITEILFIYSQLAACKRQASSIVRSVNGFKWRDLVYSRTLTAFIKKSAEIVAAQKKVTRTGLPNQLRH